MKIVIVGATGNVGRKLLEVLEKKQFPIDELFLIASSRSVGKKINFKGRSCVESKGLWKLSDISAGGPFHSLTFYDSEKERVYYIEGYVYAPGLKKRDLMQEIKSILWTFDL